MTPPRKPKAVKACKNAGLEAIEFALKAIQKLADGMIAMDRRLRALEARKR